MLDTVTASEIDYFSQTTDYILLQLHVSVR